MNFTPFRVALIYFIFAVLWITTTDQLLEMMVGDLAYLTTYQTIKGLFYITLTAVALYFMMKSYGKYIDSKKDELQKLLDYMPVFINLHGESGKVKDVNHYFEERLGYTEKDAKSSDILKMMTTDEGYPKVKSEVENPSGKWIDQELIAKDGSRLQTTWSNVRISDSLSLGIGVDISERKIMEEKLRENEEWLQLTTDSANIGKWEWNPTTGETRFDEIWARLVGYTLEELQPINIETWNDLLHPDDHEKFEEAYQKYISGEKDIYECEVRMKHKDGHWVWILDRGKAVEWHDNGIPVRLVGTHVDISDRVAYEESLLFQASLLTNISDAVISVDKEFKITSWNKAAEDIYEWKASEVIGDHLENYLPTNYDDGTTNESAFEALLNEGFWQGEITQKTKTGQVVNVFSSVTLIKNSDGEISDIIAVNRDITTRKKYEKENLLLANVFIKSNTALSVSNHKTNKLERVNQAYLNLFGYDKDEMVGLDIHDLYPEGSDSRTDDIVKKLDKERVASMETTLKKKDGSLFNGIVNLSIVEDEESGDMYRISTVQDITELKQIQNQLARERQRFEAAANNVSDVVWEWNPEEKTLWWGEGIENVMGYNKRDYENKLNFWQSKIHEDDRERVEGSMIKAENSDDLEWEEEYRFYDAENNVRVVKDSAVLIRNEENKLLRVIGAMVDITQVLEYQKELQQERNKFELIAKSSNDVLYDFNIKKGEVWWSEGWMTRFEYEADQVAPNFDWWLQRIHPDDLKRIEKSLIKAMNSVENYWSDQYRFLNGKGKYRFVIDKGFFIRNNDNKAVQMVGTISDLTLDIEARDSLKASEEQYRLLFKQSPLPMYIYDPDTLKFVAVNNSAIEKYGYAEVELLQLSIHELHPEAEYEEIKKEIARSVKKKKTGFDTWTQVKKSGEKIIAEISGSEIYYDGKIHRLVIVNDVTEQKKAEERAISAIVEGEERERHRIAKELHDGLGQYLSAANMNLETVYEDAKGLPKKLDNTFKNGLELLHYAISETRNISQNLLPKAIQDYGLELALESLINQVKNNSKVKFYLFQKIDDSQIPNNIQINLYRIAQEGINNALKHADARNISVQLIHAKNEILLTIEDDGVGFVVEEKMGHGIGLQSMKTRVGAMAANLDIVSTLGRGSIISVVVPT